MGNAFVTVNFSFFFYFFFDNVPKIGWLGATSWAVSMFTAPIIIAWCRRKSTRLTAVIGGLVLALGILFTSFAREFHQVVLSYGMFGIIRQSVNNSPRSYIIIITLAQDELYLWGKI